MRAAMRVRLGRVAGSTAPDVAGFTLTYVNNANSVSVPLPAAAVAGQLCVLAAAHGFTPNTPTGWTVDDAPGGVTNIVGRIFHKVLTSTDITAGAITATFSNTYYGDVACWVVSNGLTVRTVKSAWSSAGSTSVPITTTGSATAGDLGLYFGINRASSSSNTFSVGTLETQRATDSTFSAAMAKQAGLGAGTVSVTVSHSVAGVAHYDGIVVIGP